MSGGVVGTNPDDLLVGRRRGEFAFVFGVFIISSSS